MTAPICPFCEPVASHVVHSDAFARVLRDGGAGPGRAIVVPARHIARWEQATDDEKLAMLAAIDRAGAILRAENAATTVRVEWVEGPALSWPATGHLCVHVVTAHVRCRDAAAPARCTDRARDTDTIRPLVTGEVRDPLLDQLAVLLPSALRVDIAVAFVLERGVDRIRPHLLSLLERPDRPGKLRLVTGDYRDVSEPDALARLLDLPGDVDLRVFETGASRSFHPKAYVFHLEEDDGVAFVGSSNLTRTALVDGLEWNYRVLATRDGTGFAAVAEAFEELLRHDRVRPLTSDWIAAYRARRRPQADRSDVAPEPPPPPPEPHGIQREALAALSQAREDGATAGLVVLATGLGKTWLSAFDSRSFRRVLFVAHRDEILTQAIDTYRRIRGSADLLGRFTGTEKAGDADVLFASVQALSRDEHLTRFAPDAFDYIVVDEFHHACAATYRRLLEHFRPRFLLGLTATPERSDGGDLLGLCGDRVVFRCDLRRAIGSGLLSPLRYFGVPDEVDYTNIPWRSTRFDEEALTLSLATERRAENALEQLERHGGSRVLAFCCSTRHADFMAGWFGRHGKQAAAVHSGAHSAPRAAALEALENGELDVVFCVDMFNEGVDLPQLDTVLMLRPTESRVLWLQQIGRGLRKHASKSHVTVIDYIGNHRSFLEKPRALVSMLLGAAETPASLRDALRALQKGTAELPPGCEVTYDLAAVAILDALLAPTSAEKELRRYYEDFKFAHGVRPTAAEAQIAGACSSRQTLQRAFGGWFGLVEHFGDLDEVGRELRRRHHAFFRELETTRMNKSFEMLVLLGLVEADQMPGALPLDELARRVAAISARSPVYRTELGDRAEDPPGLRELLASEPVRAWTGSERGASSDCFAFDAGHFAVNVQVADDERHAFTAMVREIVEGRLAEYRELVRVNRFECPVWSNQRDPILKLPDRDVSPYLPEGKVRVVVDREPLEATFAKIAVNVLRKPGERDNRLPGLLRTWFGPDAGQPGRHESVVFERVEDGYRMRPKRASSGVVRVRDAAGAEIDASFEVEDVAGRPVVRFFSRGGTKGTASERNTEYQRGLDLVLGRLAARGVVIVDAQVDSQTARELSGDERRLLMERFPYPIALAEVPDAAELRKAIGGAQARVGRQPGARGSGNSTKTISLELAHWPTGVADLAALAKVCAASS